MIESALERTQGPALLAVNDSVFNDADWTAVRTMNASNKTKDETYVARNNVVSYVLMSTT